MAKGKYQDIDEIIFQFNKRIIDSTLDIVPIYKPQIAFYEAYGLKGLMAYKRTLEYIKENDSISLGDIKGEIYLPLQKCMVKLILKGILKRILLQ